MRAPTPTKFWVRVSDNERRELDRLKLVSETTEVVLRNFVEWLNDKEGRVRFTVERLAADDVALEVC